MSTNLIRTDCISVDILDFVFVELEWFTRINVNDNVQYLNTL